MITETTLDQRIREKAKAISDKEVERAFELITGLIPEGTWVEVTDNIDITRIAISTPVYKLHTNVLFKQLLTVAKQQTGAKKADQAVVDFLKRVESLGNELEEIRIEIGDR